MVARRPTESRSGFGALLIRGVAQPTRPPGPRSTLGETRRYARRDTNKLSGPGRWSLAANPALSGWRATLTVEFVCSCADPSMTHVHGGGWYMLPRLTMLGGKRAGSKHWSFGWTEFRIGNTYEDPSQIGARIFGRYLGGWKVCATGG